MPFGAIGAGTGSCSGGGGGGCGGCGGCGGVATTNTPAALDDGGGGGIRTTQPSDCNKDQTKALVM